MRDAVRCVGRVGDEEVGASGVQAPCQVAQARAMESDAASKSTGR